MGLEIPPAPISREEFDRRVAAGARTFEEIDPEFASWARRRHVTRLTVIGMAVICVLTAVAWLAAQLM
jgi:nicotinamidase-related amidase